MQLPPITQRAQLLHIFSNTAYRAQLSFSLRSATFPPSYIQEKQRQRLITSYLTDRLLVISLTSIEMLKGFAEVFAAIFLRHCALFARRLCSSGRVTWPYEGRKAPLRPCAWSARSPAGNEEQQPVGAATMVPARGRCRLRTVSTATPRHCGPGQATFVRACSDGDWSSV